MNFCDAPGPDTSGTPPTLVVAAAESKIPATLESFLAEHRLSAFHQPLLALGAAVIDDLAELSEDELTAGVERGGLGMKPLEAKRLRRGLAGRGQ
jgi:hypothetical protein